MLSKTEIKIEPKYPANGHIRMYNMFPFRRYTKKIGIEGMTEYLEQVAEMGYNAVWINPLQSTGTKTQPHPGTGAPINGSLYAMSDDQMFNPLIFPGCDTIKSCEEFLINWTRVAREQGMYPLFDLVLNHVGVNEGDSSPLRDKLADEGLMLKEVNERWPDIQCIDYYKEGSTKRGLDAGPDDLDEGKIDKVFELLWTPFITKYIMNYGFMGARVDAITHVPVPVQQRAHELIQQLVVQRFETQAMVVGEVMVGNAEHYIDALKKCQLTHCFNPYSFYWGHNTEGGYELSHKSSAFLHQNHHLTSIVEAPLVEDTIFKLKLLSKPYDPKKHTDKNSLYVFEDGEVVFYVLNGEPFLKPYLLDSDQDKILVDSIPFTKSLKGILCESFVDMFKNYLNARGRAKGVAHKNLQNLILTSEWFSGLKNRFIPQLNTGGLVGVIGNHDVGTLKAKVMLDIAYSRAMSHGEDDAVRHIELQDIYKWFKSVGIKAIENTDDLISRLQSLFDLSELETRQLFAEVNMRMREKLFIQAMSCAGGYYNIAGDELGVCHKPEVFNQFAQCASRVGSSIVTRAMSEDRQHDLRGFIQGMNKILENLPHTRLEDTARTSLHYKVLTPEIFGEKSADFLFLVVRYSSEDDTYYLLGHSPEHLSNEQKLAELENILGDDHPCFAQDETQIFWLDQHGSTLKHMVEEFKINNDEHLISAKVLSRVGIFTTNLPFDNQMRFGESLTY